MDVSRINRGQLELRKERVELASIVNSAIESSRASIDQRGHTLNVHLPESPVVLEGDPVRLAQVFMNLLNNAAKYSEPGGRIDFDVSRGDGEIVITVADRGIGIPVERLDDIFEIFSQVDRSMERSQGGLGIGLSLVKRIVELHGGVIAARSDGVGTGAEFTLKLPLPVTQIGRDSVPVDEVTDAGPSRRVLIADDNHEAADSLALLLELMGNQTRAVYDGEAAAIAAAEFKPHAVLLDIGMPKLNGLEACQRIRREAAGRPMILIALTGWGQDSDVRKSRDAGFDEHLVKPVDVDRLTAVLAEKADRL
jgi:CheY-like chemotaxis protein/two-component sensor histidine kinase